MNKKKLVYLALVFVLVLTTACGNKKVDEEVAENVDQTKDVESNEVKEEYGLKFYDDKVEFTDGRGQEVVLEKNPQRVVVLYNSYLELWMENGGSVVGRMEESKTQGKIEGTEDAEVVGNSGGGGVSIEKVIALEPDLIIMSSKNKEQGETIPFWEDNGIAHVSLDYDGLEDYHKLVRLFTFLNDRDDLFEENSVKVQKDIDEILSKLPEDTDKKVLLMSAGRNIGARDSSFWVGEIVKDFKVTNIADLHEDKFSTKELSKEILVQEDPDYILTLVMGNEDEVKDKINEELGKDPAWNSLTAVKEGRVIYLDREYFWFRPNNEYAKSYEMMGQILFPEVYGELDN